MRRRTAFLWLSVPAILGAVLAGVMYLILKTYTFQTKEDGMAFISTFMFSILGVMGLSTLIIGPSVQIQRFHDRGKSGWNVLWAAVPLIGWIFPIINLFAGPEESENQWGPNPREDSDFNDDDDYDDWEDEDDYYSSSRSNYSQPRVSGMPPRGAYSAPSSSQYGEWGDDGYEWLEHPQGSDKWYWRDPDTNEWVQY